MSETKAKAGVGLALVWQYEDELEENAGLCEWWPDIEDLGFDYAIHPLDNEMKTLLSFTQEKKTSVVIIATSAGAAELARLETRLRQTCENCQDVKHIGVDFITT